MRSERDNLYELSEIAEFGKRDKTKTSTFLSQFQAVEEIADGRQHGSAIQAGPTIFIEQFRVAMLSAWAISYGTGGSYRQ